MNEVDDLKKRIIELQSKLDEENLRILAIDSEAESWKARGNEWKEKFQAQRQRIADLEGRQLIWKEQSDRLLKSICELEAAAAARETELAEMREAFHKSEDEWKEK